jgi:hypothetical protein
MHFGNCNSGYRNRTCTLSAIGDLLPEVRMTLEEYEALIGESIGSKLPGSTRATEKQFTQRKKAVAKRKRAGKAAKGMARAMKEANKRLRTKSGKLRKGKTQADVARLAHKIRRQKYA